MVAKMEKVLLECGCDGGFSGGGEAGEPDCKSALVDELRAFETGEAGVPGYVSGVAVSMGQGEV